MCVALRQIKHDLFNFKCLCHHVLRETESDVHHTEMYVTFDHVCTLCLISLQCRSYPNIQIAQVAAMQRGMKVLDFYAAESYKGLLESMHANLEHTHYWLPSWEVTRYNVNQLLSLHLVLHYTEEKHSLDKVGLLFPSPEFAGDAPAAAGSVFPDSIFSGLKETMIAYVVANGSIDLTIFIKQGSRDSVD